MDFIYVIVIVGEMVEEVFQFPCEDAYQAERCFVDQMEQRLSNFEEYSLGDIEACVEDGYEAFGQGNSIQLHWSDN